MILNSRILCSVAVVAISLFAGPVIAETEPLKGLADNRVRQIIYDQNDIIRVQTFFGIRTLIRFPADEKIIDYNGGDDPAWDIPKSIGKNYMFVKPTQDNPDMNLIVITENAKGVQHDYNFVLTLLNQAQRVKRPFDTNEATLKLQIFHPDDAGLKRKSEAAEKAARDKKEIAKELNPGNPLQTQRDLNFDYWSCGDKEISPTSAYDDGQMIKLTFANNRDIPAIHEVLSDGSESLIQHSMSGLTTMVIPKVVKKLVLRKDPLVACVVNMSYDPDSLQDNVTGTSSAKVYRELKGNTP